MPAIRSLRSNVTRADVILQFSGRGTSALLRNALFGRLRSVAELYIPFRLFRVRIVNRILAHWRLKLSDWQGSSFLLSSPTGRTEIVDDLGHLWAAAERLSGAPIDPLSPEVIAAFEAADG